MGTRCTLGSFKPHLVMTMIQLCLAIFLIIMQDVLSKGTSGLVLVVYEHILATCVLFALAIFMEKSNGPRISLLSFQTLAYPFFLGLLMIPLCQLPLTLSLQYVAATYQSIALNLIPMMVFILAVIFGQEEMKLGSRHGQAKLLGVVLSTMGALIVVLWTGPVLLKSGLTSNRASAIGMTLLAVGMLASSTWSVLVAHLSRTYPAKDLFLASMMSFFGTLQTAAITAFLVPRSAWRLNWGGLVLLAILWGGFIITGLSCYAQTWCIYKRGPVFATAFNPLLIVFSALLQAIVLRKATHLGSILGAGLVVLGLYMLLWGKAKDKERDGKLGGVDETSLLC